MARATTLAKVPRSYFKRARPTNIPDAPIQTPTTSTFILGGKGTVAETGRQAFWANTFAKDIVNISRATHMQATMGSWQHYLDQDRLGPEVAIIVDGSGARPIKNVKLFGEIIIQEPTNTAVIYGAVLDAYRFWEMAAAPRAKTGDYLNNLHIFLDGQVWVDPKYFEDPAGMAILDDIASKTSAPPFFTIINTMPYAAKEERNTLPTGLGYGAWKAVKGKYGGEIAVRFRYYTADQVDIGANQNTSVPGKRVTKTLGATASGRSTTRDRQRYSAGQPLSFPAINIGQPGAFSSQASPVLIKAVRALRK